MLIRETYQELALKTLKPGLALNEKLLMASLGLCGEIAEINLTFGSDEELQNEIGDAFWYASLACHVCEISFKRVIDACLDMFDRAFTPTGLNDMYEIQRLMLIQSGRIAEYSKKVVLHEHSFEKDTLEIVVSQLVFYLCNLCRMLSLDIDEVLEANISKLKDRYPGGFTVEQSHH